MTLWIGVATAACPKPARAQGKLEASYGITLARISVGEAAITADVKESDYTVSLTGRAGGLARMLANGEVHLNAQGIVKDGRPEPKTFASKIVSEGESQNVSMTVDEGSVTDLTVTPAPGDGAPALSEADRKGIVDPLTAMLVWSNAAGGDLPQDACRRTVSIFDGHHRYDLKLTFKRMDKVSAQKGYTGPALVCGMTYEPIAGLGASTPLAKYLSEGREMHLTLAPVSGTRLLAPFGLSIGSTLANLVIWANRFEVIAQLQ
jgi:hypothetical protein